MSISDSKTELQQFSAISLPMIAGRVIVGLDA